MGLLGRWFDQLLERDRWFLGNLALLAAVVTAYSITSSFLLWPWFGFLRDDPAGHLRGGLEAAAHWLTSMVPLGLVALAILWRGRDRWTHPRLVALLLGFLTNAPWIGFAIASVLGGENPFFPVETIAPAFLFGALMRLPPQPVAESPPQQGVGGSSRSTPPRGWLGLGRPSP
jgi:hypothetical protein